MNGPGQSNNPGVGKIKTGSTIRTETNTVSENGVTETIITRIVTDHFTDGTSHTRRETQTTREEEVGGGQGQGQASFPSQQQQQVKNVGSAAQSSVPSPQHPAVSGYPQPQQHSENHGVEDTFVEEALRCHNKYRAKHNVPPLGVSQELCKAAQTWADQLAQKGNMENSHYGYGENIYWSSGPGHSMKGDVPVEYWYHEEVHFDWGKMDFQKATGSFTQLIWKDSRQFGIAKASGGKGTFVVAFYIPPGNVLSKFHENVFHPLPPPSA